MSCLPGAEPLPFGARGLEVQLSLTAACSAGTPPAACHAVTSNFRVHLEPWGCAGAPCPLGPTARVGQVGGDTHFPLLHSIERWLKGKGRPTPHNL